MFELLHWPSLQQPQALLLAPAFWLMIVLALRLRRRSQQWEHLIASPFHAWLLDGLPRSGRFWPSLLLGLASLCLALALSQPQFISQSLSGTPDKPVPLIIVIPLTQESLANDLPPSRLQLMQAQALELANQRLPAQTGIVVYAASAHRLMPLSNDPQATASLLSALHPQLMPSQGQDAAAAVQLAQQLLPPRQTQAEILLYSNQLTPLEQQQIRHLISKGKQRLSIIGIGTEQDHLQSFARKSGFNYLHLQQVSQSYQPMSSSQQGNRQRDQGYWFLLPMLLLLAPLARKGWLFAICLLLIPTTEALAEYQHSLPNTPEAKLIQQQPEQALQQLKDPLWLGIAAYHAGQYQLAEQHFAQINSAAARYNQANANMQLGRFQQAQSLYQQALQLDPQLLAAQNNLELAKRLQQQQAPELASQSSNQANAGKSTDTKAVTEQLSQPQYQQVDLHTWLRQIPDNPANLLQQTFWYEHLQMEQRSWE